MCVVCVICVMYVLRVWCVVCVECVYSVMCVWCVVGVVCAVWCLLCVWVWVVVRYMWSCLQYKYLPGVRVITHKMLIHNINPIHPRLGHIFREVTQVPLPYVIILWHVVRDSL